MTDGHKEQIEGERKRMGESVVAGKASEFTPAERREFMRLVREGGEVGDVVLARNIDAARRLAFLRNRQRLIGVAARRSLAQVLVDCSDDANGAMGCYDLTVIG
jgi:hypothetical protein